MIVYIILRTLLIYYYYKITYFHSVTCISSCLCICLRVYEDEVVPEHVPIVISMITCSIGIMFINISSIIIIIIIIIIISSSSSVRITVIL